MSSPLVPIGALEYKAPPVTRKNPAKELTEYQIASRMARRARSAVANALAKEESELEYYQKHGKNREPRTQAQKYDASKKLYERRVKKYGAYDKARWDNQIRQDREDAQSIRDTIKNAAVREQDVGPESRMGLFTVPRNYTLIKKLPRRNDYKPFYITSTGVLAGGPDVLVKPIGDVVNLPYNDGHSRLMTKAIASYFNRDMGPSERRILYRIGKTMKSKSRDVDM